MPVSSFRVALLVLFTIELVGGGATYRDTLILTNVGGVWLIDSLEELDPPLERNRHW